MQKIDTGFLTLRSVNERLPTYKLPSFAQSIARITHRKNDANKVKLAAIKKDISRHVDTLKLNQEDKASLISDSLSLKEARVLEKELGRLSKLDELAKDHQSRAEKYIQDTAFLSKVGARQQTTTGLEINGNIDASGVKVLSKTFGIEFGQRFDNNDEGSVRVNNVKRIMARLWTGLSFKVSDHVELGAGVQTQLSTTQTQYKKFTNHKELAHYLARKSSSKLTQQKQKALNAKLTVAPLLSEHVTNIDSKKVDHLYQSMRPEHRKTYKHGIKNRHTSEAEVNATAKFAMTPRYSLVAQAALRTAKSKESTVETVYEELTQHLTQPEHITELAPFLNAFLPKIDQPKEWMAFSEQLEKDINDYSDTVKQHDYMKSTKRWNASHECNKHRLEDKYGNIGRHQQLQFFHLCYAWLNASALQLNTSSKPSENGFMGFANRVKQALQNVDFDYSVTRLNRLTKVTQHVLETKKDLNQTASVQVGPIALTIHERERHFSHPSRVRCGDYRDVNVTLSASTNLTELLQLPALRQQLDQALADHQLDSVVDLSTLLQLDLTGLVTVQQRWFRPDAKNLIFDNQEQKQFTRYYVGTDVVASSSATAQSGAGFSLDTSLRYHQRQQQVIGENIHPKDFIYTLVRFNKLYKDAGKDLSSPNNPWSDFVQSHKDSYHDMFIALANQEGAVTEQAKTLLEQAQKEGRALISKSEFFDQMRTYLEAANTESYLKAESEETVHLNKVYEDAYLEEKNEEMAYLEALNEATQSEEKNEEAARLDQLNREAAYLNAANNSRNLEDIFAQTLIALNQLLISQFIKTEKLHKATWIKKPFKVKPSHALSKKTRIAKALKLQRKARVMKETVTPRKNT
ncbi:hypothetical protein GCM10007938_29770 [Vibrio zhanjiangensis]|uniref:Uncharacterized protein n=1 Tax=Vibrio zhanjiangensis TaxID=1046128 RepID=A0ABQ6F169_9VIBR|nr:hypothetical protein [Vibrio zhanjiangensis]GLT19195.1 hypothetical protein GCM10007938_29770 [Vibrio zhanjiangensis]